MSKTVGVGVLLIASLVQVDASQAQSETFYVVQWSRYMTSEVYRIGRDGSIQQTMARLNMDRTGAVTTVGNLPGTGTLWARSDLTRRDSRHLTWFMNRAPHDRSLRLSFPGEAGRSYVVGLTLSGADSGIPLPDGRTIPLNFDGLTAVSVTGSLPSIMTGTVGVLDATGAATARIDVASVASVLKGIRVVAAAIVTDPSAPSGLAHVSGATGFTIR
jgi:hypothetical protein